MLSEGTYSSRERLCGHFSAGDVSIAAGGLVFVLGATGALRRRRRPGVRPLGDVPAA
jgi:hypothetical protein